MTCLAGGPVGDEESQTKPRRAIESRIATIKRSPPGRRKLRAAMHPAPLPKKDGDGKPDEAAREELLNALAAEPDEDEEQEA